MAILVDSANWAWRDNWFCHLVSDQDLHELHSFARWIGVPQRAFGGDHYDVHESMRMIAVEVQEVLLLLKAVLWNIPT